MPLTDKTLSDLVAKRPINGNTFQVKTEKKQYNIICFIDGKWNYVFQRSLKLFHNALEKNTVYFIAEPEFKKTPGKDRLKISTSDNYLILTPCIHSIRKNDENANKIIEELIREELRKKEITFYISWYYAPSAINYSRNLDPKVIIYDCIDENFPGADSNDSELICNNDLIEISDIIFTTGKSRFDHLKAFHKNVHYLPDCYDKEHFSSLRNLKFPDDPLKKMHIGFLGIIDEKIDIALLIKLAKLKSDWEFVIAGPLINVAFKEFSKVNNITYLGDRIYIQFPHLMKNWDAAILPFKMDKNSEHISSIRAMEYLSGGMPVVSTPFKDILCLADKNIVLTANTPEDFVAAIEESVKLKKDPEWKLKVEKFLKKGSCRNTWDEIEEIINKKLKDLGVYLQ